MKLLITCEHAGNHIPAKWRKLVPIPKNILKSHEGIDIGAKRLAQELAAALDAPLFDLDICRLLIENNRSLHHAGLFSRFAQHLDKQQRQELVDTLYLPYRKAVQAHINKNLPLFHLSVHSFTPVLHGAVRNADVGLLYDPGRKREKQLAANWKSLLADQWRVRMNYPYLGTSDGFVTALRRQYPATQYIGMELEVMNTVLTSQRAAITQSLISSLKTLMGDRDA